MTTRQQKQDGVLEYLLGPFEPETWSESEQLNDLDEEWVEVYRPKRKLKSKNYTKYLDKAKKYNEDCKNDIFISEITDTSQSPRHTTCLPYTLPTGLRQVNLRARDLKHNPIGINPWECIYALPMSV